MRPCNRNCSGKVQLISTEILAQDGTEKLQSAFVSVGPAFAWELETEQGNRTRGTDANNTSTGKSCCKEAGQATAAAEREDTHARPLAHAQTGARTVGSACTRDSVHRFIRHRVQADNDYTRVLSSINWTQHGCTLSLGLRRKWWL